MSSITMAHNAVDIVSGADLARYFQTTTRTIQDWIKVGMPKVARDKYSVQDCIKWRIDQRIAAELRAATPAKMTVDDAQTRKLTAEAVAAEYKTGLLTKNLVDVDNAARQLSRHLSVVRADLLSFPARLAPFVVMIPSEGDARILLEEQVAKLMQGMLARITDMPTEETDDDDPDE